MIVTEHPDRVRVCPSDDEHRPIRIELPGREPVDVTRAELIALQRLAGAYLLRTFPAPSVRRTSNSGG
jgi:hypothetical protein